MQIANQFRTFLSKVHEIEEIRRLSFHAGPMVRWPREPIFGSERLTILETISPDHLMGHVKTAENPSGSKIAPCRMLRRTALI